MVFPALKKTRIHIAALVISVCLSLALAALTVTDIKIPLASYIELKTQDLRFRIRGPEKPLDDIVIAAIDEKSLEAVGRWPWPRLVLASLLSVLDQTDVRAVGIDLLLTEPETNPELERVAGLIAAYEQLGLLDDTPVSQAFYEEMLETAQSADNDGLLAQMIRENGKTVLAMAFHTSSRPPDGFDGLPDMSATELKNPERIEDLERVAEDAFIIPLSPLPAFIESAHSVGFVNVEPDLDGCVRKGRVIREYRNSYHVSLPVRMAQLHLSKKSAADFFAGAGRIPLDENGYVRIGYYGPGNTFPFYSIIDILTGQIPPETLAGKSVFIGGAATGLGDHWVNPYDELFWGVELQATVADNILSGRFMRRPPYLKYVDAMILLFIAAVLFPVTSKAEPLNAALFSAGLTGLFVFANQMAFNELRLMMLWVYPVLEIVLISAVVFVFRYAGEGREKRILKNAFQRYLNPAMVDRIVNNPEKLILGGEYKELTVLFSDIRGFTHISEELDPKTLVHFMNTYLTAMTDILLKNGGTLDKYIGDAVMALFGAPENQTDHAVRACTTALEMIDALKNLRIEWRAEGLPEVQIGVGVNTGDMIVGNVGSLKRFNYTVMGDHVNLTSRLEGLTKQYGVDIIVSETTREQTGGRFLFRELDFVRVKGKMKPVRIFELLSFSGPVPEFVTHFEAGLSAYRSEEWDPAAACFEKALTAAPDDKPSAYFIERCAALKQDKTDSFKDGVFVMPKK